MKTSVGSIFQAALSRCEILFQFKFDYHLQGRAKRGTRPIFMLPE